MVDQEWQSAMRGYSRIIIGIHPDSGERIELGYAEIRVFGERGRIYAAPNLLYHYVIVHHYKPPEEFVHALKYSPCPPEPEYLSRLEALGLPLSLIQSHRRSLEAEKLKRAEQKRKSV